MIASGTDPFGLREPREGMFAPRGTHDPMAQATPPPGRATARLGLPQGTPGHGPLVQTGFGLLTVAALLRGRTPPAKLDSLRASIELELERFSGSLRKQGIDAQVAELGNYCLCALLDDVVLNTPWGAEGAWRDNSLAVALHHDNAAGENFFVYLERARQSPEQWKPALELMASCLALGFEGRYRLTAGGAETLRRLRSGLMNELSQQGRDSNPDLSGHWQGIPVPHRRLSGEVPLWVYGTAVLLLLLLLYGALQLTLGKQGGRLDALVESIPPAGPVDIIRAAVLPQRALPAAQPIAGGLVACLAGATSGASDAVVEDENHVQIRLPGNGLFAVGQADINDAWLPPIQCVRDVLAHVPGNITVVGHTDTLPIHTAAFPDNWALSKARADAVAAVLQPARPDSRQLRTVGRAGTEPLARNNDAAGRALNRRVDIVLTRSASVP